jgi:hypothetical protein
MPTPSNSLDISSAGLVKFDGTNTFTAVTTTQFNALIGGASNGVTSVAPTATSGVPLVSNGAASNPTFSTALVPGGGTGGVSYTAYCVICAGTTATGNFQNVVSVGSSGTVLTSNGAAALPTFQALSTSGAITLTKFTASGTWTKGASTKYVAVLIWNGGGGGGSGRRGLTTAAGGGGGGTSGGGIYFETYAGAYGASETVTIAGTAAGGIAVGSDTTNGNPGTINNFSIFGNSGFNSSSSTLGVGGTTTSATGGTAVNFAFGTPGTSTLSASGQSGGSGGNAAGTSATGIGQTSTDKYFAAPGGGGSGADSTTARQAGKWWGVFRRLF